MMTFLVIYFAANTFFANDMLFHEVGEGEGTPTITSYPVWVQYLALIALGSIIIPILYIKLILYIKFIERQ